MRRRQARADVAPAGTHESLPETQRLPFCQIELRKRSSFVSIVPPGCIAFGGAEVAGIAMSVSVTTTLFCPGVPVISRTPANPPPLNVTTSAGVELSDWAGTGLA